MFAKNSQMIIGLLIVATLAVVGSLLLSNNVGPASVQSQDNWPTPPTPDFAGFATSYCCDSGTVVFETPSAEQIALWTEVAKTQEALRQPNISVTAQPPAQVYLAPSEETKVYTEPNLGYSFEYPDNWFIFQTSRDVITLTNFPIEIVEKSPDNPNRFRLDIYLSESLESYASLESYVTAHDSPSSPSKVLSQKTVILENGNTIVWQERDSEISGMVINAYLTNGKQVYKLIGPSPNANYIGVVDQILKSFSIPD